MKLVIFAGGSGKRFWPMSRENYPKQFQPVINNKSTLELQLENLSENYGWYNTYFSTTENLVSLVKSLFSQVPIQNIVTEPVRRDVGPAVGLAMTKLAKIGAANEPVAVLWGDSFTQNKEKFKDVLQIAEQRIIEDPDQFIWLGQKPLFANENLGWMELGEQIGTADNGVSYFRPAGFKYRPTLEDAKKWTEDGKHLWNTGYFVTTPQFILKKIEENAPDVAKILNKIGESLGTDKESQVIKELYPTLPTVHFDHLVLDHLKKEESVIVEGDFGWSDPGTLYALKQVLAPGEEENATKGNVFPHDTSDSLIYNFVNHQVVTTVGLDGYVVVNTPDAVLVCPKDKIGDIKKMLSEFKDNPDLAKYL